MELDMPMRLSQRPSVENQGRTRLHGLRVFGSTKPSEVNDFLAFASLASTQSEPRPQV